VPTTDPATVVTNFYNWYHNENNVRKSLTTAPGGSQAFEDWYNTATKAEGVTEGGGYDPIDCAQDVPQSFSVKTSSKNSTSAQVLVTENFDTPSVLTVDLTANNGSWLMKSVTCPS
jgi:hypothetical protein